MNICDLCSYSTSVKCNLKRHRASKHKNCEGVVATEPMLKTRKSTRKYESKYTLLFNLINDLKNEIIKLKNVVNSLKPVSVKCVPVVKVTDLSVNTVQITCEYLTETFAGAPNIETIIAEIGIGNGDYFEPIDRIEDEHELITTLNLSYKGQQLIFDNGDPFSWTTAYFIDDIDDYLEKCKHGKENFYLSLFKKAVARYNTKCFYYDKKEDLYWVKSKDKWNTFWKSEARTLRFDIVDTINKFGYNIIRYSKCDLIETTKDDVSNLITELRKDVDCKLFETSLLFYFKSS